MNGKLSVTRQFPYLKSQPYTKVETNQHSALRSNAQFERRRSLRRRVLAPALCPLLAVTSENPANPGQCLNPNCLPLGVRSIRAPKLHTQTQAKGLALDVAMKLGLT